MRPLQFDSANSALSKTDEVSCWRCLSTVGPFVELDGIKWRRRGEAKLRPALVCQRCRTMSQSRPEQIDLFGAR